MAELLLQESHDRSGALSRARPVYSTHEAEEYPASSTRRGTDHAPGARVLRLVHVGGHVGRSEFEITGSMRLRHFMRQAESLPCESGLRHWWFGYCSTGKPTA